ATGCAGVPGARRAGNRPRRTDGRGHHRSDAARVRAAWAGMTIEVVAVCPGTPLLSPDVAVTADGVAAVQEAAREAVATVAAASVDEVVVIGEAPATREYDGTWDWRGFG